MSIRAMQWVWDLDGLKSGPKFVLLALADYADEEGSCFPGQDKIAARVACSVDTVARSLKILEEAGLITRTARRKEGGYRTSDRFFLHVGSQTRKLQGSVSPRNEPDSHPANAPILTPQIAGVTPSKNPQIEPPVSITLESAFETWWPSYPKKVGKGQARKAFRTAAGKISKDLSIVLDTLVTASLAYDKQEKAAGTESRFYKNPATWLNGECWADQPLAPLAGPQSAASRAMAVDLGDNAQGAVNSSQIAYSAPRAIGPSILGEMNEGRW